MSNSKIYFPNLNGLRFLAALLVIIHHIEQLKSRFSIPNYWNTNAFIGVAGKLGVVLFFVLSGFLITYLLVMEEKRFNGIHIKGFYLRRVLRIWPLYFLIIILAFFVLPHVSPLNYPGFNMVNLESTFLSRLALYVFFLPNLALIVFGIMPFASHTWSVGTEEQFYLIWPLLLTYFRKNRMLLMIGIIMLYLLLKSLLYFQLLNFIPFHYTLLAFLTTFNIDCMAIGGIYAILLFQKTPLLKSLLNINLFYSVLLVTILLIGFGIRIPVFHYEAYAVLFGIIIMNFAANERLATSLENRVLHYFGKISYGLYMFHPIAIVGTLILCNSLKVTSNFLIYPLSFIATASLASVSYFCFEVYFLKVKDYYSKLKSGGN